MLQNKVLYIGHYRDGTGWGNAALNNILALDAAGVDVVPRAITYEKDDKSYPSRIKELESQSKDGCNVVIQHTLPVNYSYDSRYKNIGCLTAESSNFLSTGWQDYCNLMDEIWVPSKNTADICRSSNVVKPIKVVPYSLDIERYTSNNEPNNGPIDEMINNFTFGFVGEFIERKNAKALCQAFHMEFSPNEPVNIFFKTSKKELSHIQNYFDFIKKGLKLRKNHKEELILSGMVPEDDYISILKQIDCFVMPSRGEAFCIPSLEAMALGIPSIWTDGIGMEHCKGIPVKSYSVPCFGAVETLTDLDTAESTWKEIDIIELGKAMRKMYETLVVPELKEDIAMQCKQQAGHYSHEEVGKKMKEIINDR
jgi:glycosyltransferase involved in cell wall biosynthesis